MRWWSSVGKYDATGGYLVVKENGALYFNLNLQIRFTT